MKLLHWFSTSVLVVLLVGGGSAFAEGEKKSKETYSFGSLRTLTASEAKEQAEAWLKKVGKTDEVTVKEFSAIWAEEDRAVLDKVSDSLMLGNPEAKKLLTDARNPKVSAPTEVPAILKDTKIDAFVKGNLALAYAKALSNRRIYEESLDCLKTVKAEQVVDPGQYLFLKAVAEHALMMRKDADESIIRLLDDVPEAPERYKMVAALMHFDMLSWRDKDLGWIARKMDNIERRLELSRGGKQTQDMQKQVIARLDEIIKEKENQNKSGGS